MQFYNRAFGFAKEAIAGPLERRQDSSDSESIPMGICLSRLGTSWAFLNLANQPCFRITATSSTSSSSISPASTGAAAKSASSTSSSSSTDTLPAAPSPVTVTEFHNIPAFTKTESTAYTAHGIWSLTTSAVLYDC